MPRYTKEQLYQMEQKAEFYDALMDSMTKITIQKPVTPQVIQSLRDAAAKVGKVDLLMALTLAKD